MKRFESVLRASLSHFYYYEYRKRMRHSYTHAFIDLSLWMCACKICRIWAFLTLSSFYVSLGTLILHTVCAACSHSLCCPSISQALAWERETFRVQTSLEAIEWTLAMKCIWRYSEYKRLGTHHIHGFVFLERPFSEKYPLFLYIERVHTWHRYRRASTFFVTVPLTHEEIEWAQTRQRP